MLINMFGGKCVFIHFTQFLFELSVFLLLNFKSTLYIWMQVFYQIGVFKIYSSSLSLGGLSFLSLNSFHSRRFFVCLFSFFNFNEIQLRKPTGLPVFCSSLPESDKVLVKLLPFSVGFC